MIWKKFRILLVFIFCKNCSKETSLGLGSVMYDVPYKKNFWNTKLLESTWKRLFWNAPKYPISFIVNIKLFSNFSDLLKFKVEIFRLIDEKLWKHPSKELCSAMISKCSMTTTSTKKISLSSLPRKSLSQTNWFGTFNGIFS